MPIPNIHGKHDFESLFSPTDKIQYLKEKNLLPDFPIPDGIIFCYQTSLFNHIIATNPTEKIDMFYGEFHLLKEHGKKIGLCGRFGNGAPIVTTIMEEAIALGVKKFLSIGTAGALQPDLNIGDLVVCNKAVRDEGVSHHYLPPSTYIDPSANLTQKLKDTLSRHKLDYREGASWTIDAPYRETKKEIDHYREEGVLTVEMEASALFAVAKVRNVELATAFVVSDILGDIWQPHLRSPYLTKKLMELFEISKEVILG